MPSPIPSISLDVLEAVQMLWRFLDCGKKDRMRPIGGGPTLRIARQILNLQLKTENKERFRAWGLRVGAEQRVKQVGLNPETGAVVDPAAWEIAVSRALDELQDRKARKQLYKENRRKQVREAVAAANGHSPANGRTPPAQTISPPAYPRRTERQRVPVDHKGFATHEGVEIPNPNEMGQVIGHQHDPESFGGSISQTTGSWCENMQAEAVLYEQRVACRRGQSTRSIQAPSEDRPGSVY